MITDFLDSIPSYLLDRSKHLELKVRSVEANRAIDEILSKTVLKGGKRLRPLLTFLMGNLFKIDLDLITPFAKATELVHAASLSHDDVIDNATERRGAPSINILASNKKAVLAGDYLLSSVIVDLCETGELSLVKEMSLVIKDLSEGEWLQLDLVLTKSYTRELIREIALKKTSSVMSYCTLAPAVYAQMPKDIIEKCSQFGTHLGMAFQLIDDTLDYSHHSEKDQHLDLKNGIVNSVVFELFVERPDLMMRFKEGEDLFFLLKGIEMSAYAKVISKEAEGHLEKARETLVFIGGYLGQNLYTHSKENLEESLSYLHLIISYMALRQH